MAHTIQPLQNILLSPSKPVPLSLCYKGDAYEGKKGCLTLKKGAELDFTTYFNVFSWEKWRLYTGLESLFLCLDLHGNCRITLQSHNEKGDAREVHEYPVMASGDTSITVPVSLLKGKIGFKISAVSHTRICSGYWAAKGLPYNRDIRPVFITCTYNRDEYLFPNLERLKEARCDNYDVMVVDNASRIPADALSPLGEGFHLFSNPNAGGSGGFTRGLMEALSSKNEYTHAILMDDDIAIEPETLVRSCRLLRFLKPEYHGHFLSGSMFYMDRPETMFESTGAWNGFRVSNGNKDRDMSRLEDLCAADSLNNGKNRYAAWWYCGIPLNREIKNALPFPFFIYGDDMDFSLSWAKGFLTLEGIGVWHESFTRKFSPLFKSYFFCRNTTILNALHPSLFGYLHSSLNTSIHFWVQLFVHDYRSASLALDALEDFLEGAEYVTALDEQEILKRADAATTFKTPGRKDLLFARSIKANFRRWYAPFYFFHRKLAAWNHDHTEAEIRIRSPRKIIKLITRHTLLHIRFLFSYSKAARSFLRLKRDEYFWKTRFRGMKESA